MIQADYIASSYPLGAILSTQAKTRLINRITQIPLFSRDYATQLVNDLDALIEDAGKGFIAKPEVRSQLQEAVVSAIMPKATPFLIGAIGLGALGTVLGTIALIRTRR